MAAFDSKSAEAPFFECGNQAGAGHPGDSGSCGNSNPLDPNELQGLLCRTLDFEAQLDRLADAFDDLVQRTRLCMASRDLWNGGNVVTFLVALNDGIVLA